MTGTTLTIDTTQDAAFTGYLALPPGGSGPGLILGQEIFGVNDYMRRMADHFAEEGYVVLVPDLFWRLEPGVSLGYEGADRERAFALYERFDATTAVADIARSIAVLRERPEVTGGVGFVGYCLGGTLAFLVAAQGLVEVSVGYYGVGLENLLDKVPDIQCPLVLHVAGQDAFTPPEVVARLQEATASNNHIRLYRYPEADHAFASDERPSYNRAATELAYSRTLRALRSALGPEFDLEALWEAHLASEFATKDAAEALQTMVERPYVNHVPNMTGGTGRAYLQRFYRYHFIPGNPPDTQMTPVSRTVAVDQIVDEFIFSFTHTQEIDWLVPGIPPTGKAVTIPMVAIVKFRGNKICHEHIYWDQASVLLQLGLLDGTGLPVAGAITAAKVLDEDLPSNELMPSWPASEGKPL